MADYRLIFRNASTGARTSSLSHLGFRVWVQYQLSADDFGVCPALAAKFQGDNDALHHVSAKKVQAEIDHLIALKLCGVFVDGGRRYLYQPDWQDWQRLKYATASSSPPIPGELLEKCSAKTRALFSQFHPKISETFSPHAITRDASATADADAVAVVLPEESPRETIPARGLIVSSSAWDREHGKHVAGFCDWLCLPQSVFDGFVRLVRASGMSEVDAIVTVKSWAQHVRADWVGRIPGANIFDFWRNEWQATHGSNKPSSGGSVDPLAGVREAIRRG